jgi:hypothetical protein
VRKILNIEFSKLKNQLNYSKMILEKENLVGYPVHTWVRGTCYTNIYNV